MALTNLNALGSAIRGKVGEEEKKTLPQLKSIVDNQLVYPQGTYTATTNGTYDVSQYASVNVETDERTAQDYKNAEDIASWNALFSQGTGTLSISASMKPFTGIIPYIDARSYKSLANTFLGSNASSVTVHLGGTNENLSGAFSNMPNIKKIKIVGDTSQIAIFTTAFGYNSNLIEIEGELDFTHATNIDSIFYTNPKLTSIAIKPNSITCSNDSVFHFNSKKSVILSYVNGLATVDVYHSTKFSTTLKNYLGATAGVEASYWCKLVDGLYVDCEKTDDGAVSYASVINSKGWTII